MKKILIISATSKTNFILAKQIKNIIDQNNILSTLIVLEDLNLPLYSEKNHKCDSLANEAINRITDKLINADALILCAPEYNGSIPPIVTNMIAWISVTTDYWKDGFNNKFGFIGTSSGGEGKKFFKSIRLQLEHLGMTVFNKTIVVNTNKPFNEDNAINILKQFISII